MANFMQNLNAGTIALAVLIVLLLILIVSNIHVVQQSKAYVVERLGAFHAVWGVGLHLKLPFIERVVKKVSLKEQVADFDPQPVITKDNVTMQIDTVIYFQITDPKLYTYGVEYPMSAIENLTATTLRNIIGDLELDQSLTSHRPLGHQGQPRGAEEYSAAPRNPERHGKADEGRARAPGIHSPGGGPEGQPDSGGRGREAVRYFEGGCPEAGPHHAGRG